jgi:CRISPR-associated protein Cmr2
MHQSWDDLLLAFLHDPPDKALDLRAAAQRACRYASTAVGRMVSASALEALSDQLASVAERVPTPTAGEGGLRAVEPRHGRLTVFHPLSGERSTLAVGRLDDDAVQRTIAAIVAGLDAPRDRFLAVWRLLPERLAADWPWSALLPADTRIPDHTIWHHLDAAAGLRAALSGPHGGALLSFSLGPVQEFIEAARSVRDLCSGSFIVSWLTFQAMLPIVEQLGPTAIVYPSLRGAPLLDLWLHQHTAVGRKLERDAAPQRRAAGLPNRFLAIVPWGPKGDAAHALAGQCETAAKRAWTALASAVRERLNPVLRPIAADWDKRWDEQIQGFFEIRTATLPLSGTRGEVEHALAALWGKPNFAEAFPQAASVRKLADVIPDEACPSYLKRSNPARANLSGLWQAQVELSARLMESQRAIVHLPPPTRPDRSVPPKCSLMGSYEQMGPDGLDDSRRFWEEAEMAFRGNATDGIRLRKHERLCAVALVKRFAGCVELHSRQWPRWSTPDLDEGGPSKYYTVLAMGGDNIGGWQQGEDAPVLRDVLHPDLRDYFAALTGTEAGLAAPRPLGPALQAAISQALTNFALHVAPQIVEQYSGTLIYAGGGDLLALLPFSTALACAHELRLAFSGDPRVNRGARSGYYRDNGHDLLVMGSRVTASAGLAVVQSKEVLRFGLAAARKALNDAKYAGRDIQQVVACRPDGEQTAALCPWDFVDTVRTWTDAFSGGASDRWVYRLREDLPTLKAVGREVVLDEIRRHLDRSEEPARDKLPPGDITTAFDAYRRAMQGRQRAAADLEGFVALCQTASLLARGGDL